MIYPNLSLLGTESCFVVVDEISRDQEPVVVKALCVRSKAGSEPLYSIPTAP
jgi:hypothetical protein